MTACKSSKELVVEVVPVRDDNQSRVLHRRVQHNATCVKHHRQALTRTLSMPDDTDPLIAAGTSRPQGRFQCEIDRVVLVIAGHLLTQCSAAGVFKNDEMADEVKKSPLLE